MASTWVVEVSLALALVATPHRAAILCQEGVGRIGTRGIMIGRPGRERQSGKTPEGTLAVTLAAGPGRHGCRVPTSCLNVSKKNNEMEKFLYE